jgi:hypothetical protein
VGGGGGTRHLTQSLTENIKIAAVHRVRYLPARSTVTLENSFQKVEFTLVNEDAIYVKKSICLYGKIFSISHSCKVCFRTFHQN